jgi:hypothetical protein
MQYPAPFIDPGNRPDLFMMRFVKQRHISFAVGVNADHRVHFRERIQDAGPRREEILYAAGRLFRVYLLLIIQISDRSFLSLPIKDDEKVCAKTHEARYEKKKVSFFHTDLQSHHAKNGCSANDPRRSERSRRIVSFSFSVEVPKYSCRLAGRAMR